MEAGRIQSIAFGPHPGLPRAGHELAELAAGHGIVGDHLAGRSPERALNILDAAQLEALRDLGYAVSPGSLGENLVLSGLDLDALAPGTRLQLGAEVLVRLVKPRTGCQNLSYLHPDFPTVAEGRLGQMCAVEHGGTVRVGDGVRVVGGGG